MVKVQYSRYRLVGLGAEMHFKYRLEFRDDYCDTERQGRRLARKHWKKLASWTRGGIVSLG